MRLTLVFPCFQPLVEGLELFVTFSLGFLAVHGSFEFALLGLLAFEFFLIFIFQTKRL